MKFRLSASLLPGMVPCALIPGAHKFSTKGKVPNKPNVHPDISCIDTFALQQPSFTDNRLLLTDTEAISYKRLHMFAIFISR